MFKISRGVKYFILLPVLIIIIAVIIVSYMALSRNPFNKEVSGDMSISSMIELKKKINREIKHIFSADPAAERTVILTKSEMNTAFDLYTGVTLFGGLVSKENQPAESFDLRRINFANGIFSVFVSRRLFSLGNYIAYLNIEADIIPSISGGKLALTVKKLRCGDISIPVSILNTSISGRESQINDSEDVRKVLDCIEEFRVENSTVTIVYYPRKLMEYFPRLKRFKF